MRASAHPNALRVAAALGPNFTVVEFDESTHTAQEAAAASPRSPSRSCSAVRAASR